MSVSTFVALACVIACAYAQPWTWTLETKFCCNDSAALKPAATRVITLGGLFPITGRGDNAGLERANVMALAISEINANRTLLPDTLLNGWILDTENTDAGALSATFSMISATDVKVSGLVGSARSSESQIVAVVGSVVQMPQLSYSSTSAVLSDKNNYPYFGRTAPSDALQATALVSLLVRFGYERCVVVYTNDECAVAYGQSIQAAVQQLGSQATPRVVVVAAASFPTPLDPSNPQDASTIQQTVQVIKSSGAHVVILASDSTGLFIVRAAASAGLVSDKYVWIASDSFAQDGLLAAGNGDRQYLAGMLGTRPVSLVGPVGQREFVTNWATYNRTIFPNTVPNTYSPYVYDAVYAFALALNTLISNGTAITGSVLYKAITETTFVGATGDVLFNAAGDRLGGKYDIVNVVGADESAWTPVGTWDTLNGLQLSSLSALRFGSGLKPFANRPTDVSITTRHQMWSSPAAIVIIVLAVVMFALTLATLVVWVINVRTPVVGSYQPALGFFILAGMMLGCGACYAVVAPASGAACALAPWMGGIAFQLAIGTLVIKAFAIWIHKIRKPEQIRFGLPLSIYLPILAGFLAFELAFLVIWTAVDRPLPSTQRVDFSTRIRICASDARWTTRGWWALFVAPKFLMMLAATIVAPFLVNIHMVFQEAKYTAYFFACADLVGAVAVAVTWALYETHINPNVSALIAALGILLTAWFCWLIVFGPKLLVVFVRRGSSVKEAEIDRNFDPTELDRIELM